MNRQDDIRAIHDAISTALYIADGLPTTVGQLHLRDTLIGALQEVEVLYPASEARDAKGRAA